MMPVAKTSRTSVPHDLGIRLAARPDLDRDAALTYEHSATVEREAATRVRSGDDRRPRGIWNRVADDRSRLDRTDLDRRTRGHIRGQFDRRGASPQAGSARDSVVSFPNLKRRPRARAFIDETKQRRPSSWRGDLIIGRGTGSD
jgi:hypothetical protein